MCAPSLFRSILSVRFSTRLFREEVLMFFEVVNIVVILYFHSLSEIFLPGLISRQFAESFTRLSDVLPAYTCASSMGNHLCSNCFGGNILSPFP